MTQLQIEGQQPLNGTIQASGMKNAATPIIAATIVTQEPCVIANVPRIADVFKMLEILQSMGADVSWQEEHTLRIQCKDIDPKQIDQKAVKALRSSVLLLGPLIARFPEVSLAQPGGCIIGNRPLTTHFEALQGLGIRIEEHEDMIHVQRSSQLTPAEITLSEFSVTATENVLIAAATTEGETLVHLAAAEPHVQDVAAMLVAMGATIDGIGTHTLHIRGTKKLTGVQHTIIPDQIEIGTWMIAGAITKGEMTITGIIPEHMRIIFLKLRQAGVPFILNDTSVTIPASTSLQSFRLQTLPYPGFPTDLQAPFAVLATQAKGTSLIQDPMFEGRMGYVSELISMGANAVVCDPHRVLITGPTPLYGSDIKTLDLRAGATLILAALIANGRTTIQHAEIIDRGYEAIDERLRSLGATITRDEQ